MTRDPGRSRDGSPLLDEAQAAAVLAVDDRAQATEMREIFQEMEAVVAAHIAALQEGLGSMPPDEALRRLHSLKGNTGAFGLARCADLVATAEKNWPQLVIAEQAALLADLTTAFDASTAELRDRFPHVAS